MIFLVLAVLALTMLAVLVMDKTWTRFLVAGTHIGLIIVIFSYAVIWLKNGGIGDTRWYIFAPTPGVKRALLYYPISAETLSQILLLGKSLFLCFSMITAAYISQPLKNVWNGLLGFLAVLAAVFNYVLLHPQVFSLYCRKSFFIHNQIMIFNGIRLVYLACVALCVGLMINRYRKIKVRWVRKRFSYIIPFMLNLHFLFIVFAVLGPIQVSHFTGIYYIHSNFLYLSREFWILLLIVSILCICAGSHALWSYSQYAFLVESPDIAINKKLRESDASVKMLNHGMKNQLLVLREMLRDFGEESDLKQEEKEKILAIQGISEEIITRMDVIYHAFIKKSMVLTEVEFPLHIVEAAVHRFCGGSIPIQIQCIEQFPILADENYLTEAICNVIKNGLDSIQNKETGGQDAVLIKLYRYGKNMVFEVSDTGEGMSWHLQKKIFEPFYTSKNSKNNWGIGLTYTYQIVRAHFGKIHIDSGEGVGTNVFIMIPTYKIQ